MKLEDLNFSSTDVIKLLGFVLTLSSMWYDLKTDIAVEKEYNKLLEWRVGQLEKSDLACVPTQRFAVIPKETEIKEE